MDRETWDDRYQGEGLLWTDRPNRFLVAEVSGLQPGRALDLACGEGRNAVWLAEQGWQVTGVDFSCVALEKARRLAEKRGVAADWICADLLEYTPSREAFELVILFYVQLPADQRREILSRAASAVAPGGTFLLVAHAPENLERGYGGPRNPAVLYGAEEVLPALEGFEIERAGPVMRPIESGGETREAIDTLVRARR
jgi:2-polyprenyl-3-methyl-5-hydroxy-6-metoxy-1,4-benzoquinol methylase